MPEAESKPGTDVERELRIETSLLDEVERGGPPWFRVWETKRTTVVVGRSVRIGDEVDEAACRLHEVPIVRRASGGRSVVIGPGTLQYAFVLPYDLDPGLASIGGTKSFCNALLLAGLATSRPDLATRLHADPSGDLVLDDRKVAGSAMRRRRRAVLLHGTILVTADIETITALLRHPIVEPPYRRGRGHAEFLANLGSFDVTMLVDAIVEALHRLDGGAA